MASIVQGDGTKPIPTTGAKTRVAIAATSNATPIQVTTKTNHGFYTGSTVELEGTGLAAFEPGVGQSTWIVTVLDAVNFTLNSSIAPGATSSSGYCVCYSVEPAFQVPDPGDTASMVTMGPIIQGQANAIPWSYKNAGKYRIYNLYEGLLAASPANLSDPYTTSWSATATFSAGNNFVNLSGVSLDQLLNGGVSGKGTVNGPVVVNQLDVLEVDYMFSCELVASVDVAVTFHLAAFFGTAANFHQVTHSTNGSPVQVTTGTAHGLSTGDYAAIIDSAAVGLNNLWKVTVVGANDYTLNGSTGIAASGACTSVSIPAGGGTVQPLRPSNQPLIVAPAVGLFTPVTVRGVLGGGFIPASNAAFSPSSLTWFGLYVNPVTAANLSQLNMIAPAMCTVRHLRVN
jgi:hypothetical protein